jgi:hypothetical protein
MSDKELEIKLSEGQQAMIDKLSETSVLPSQIIAIDYAKPDSDETVVMIDGIEFIRRDKAEQQNEALLAQVAELRKAAESAFDLTIFIKMNEYPEIMSPEFHELTTLADKQEQALIKIGFNITNCKYQPAE